MSVSKSLSTKPYLVRAIYDWCVESGFTPYIAVQVDQRTRVPPQHVQDGQIVLNIAPYATGKLLIDAEAASFQARFSGKLENLYVPLTQILAIYARENGQGMAFQPGAIAGSAMELGGVQEQEESGAAQEPVAVPGVETEIDPDPQPPVAPAAKGAHLRRVK